MEFSVQKSSVNMARVCHDVFGKVFYLSNGRFYVLDPRLPDGELIGDTELVWDREKSLCWGPNELMRAVLSAEEFSKLRKNYNLAARSHRRHSGPARLSLDEQLEIDQQGLNEREGDSVWEMDHYEEQGYVFDEKGIKSPMLYDSPQLPVYHLDDFFYNLKQLFDPMSKQLLEIFWPNAVARLEGPEKVVPAMFGDTYSVTPAFCHDSQTKKSMRIYAIAREQKGPRIGGSRQLMKGTGLYCHGCHYSEAFVPSFVVRQFGFDAELVRGFFKPYYDHHAKTIEKIPDSIEELNTVDLTAALIGTAIWDDF